MRRATIAGVLWVGLVGCKRDRGLPRPPPSTEDAGSSVTGGGPGVAGFSRPIAAAHLASGTTLVAGLVAATSSVVATALASDGRPVWTVTALGGASWSPNAELKVLPGKDVAAIVWRGLQGDKSVTRAVLVGPAGDIQGEPFEAGPAACATDEALAWLAQDRGGRTRVRARPWRAPSASELLVIPADRDPEIVCGAHTIYALGGGEDDVTVAVVRGAEAGAPVALIRDREFSSDEEREHHAYTVAESLGVVRVGNSGTIAVREVGDAGPAPWRALATKIARDDDVVAVDADVSHVVVVFTREEGERCDGGGGLSIHVLRAGRNGADGASSESEFELAPSSCDRDPGPFWTGALDCSFAVGWAERAHKAGPSTAPIAGLSSRAFGEAPLDSVRHTDVESDDIVPAGCDRDRCYAVALVRPPGTDGMQPEGVQVILYP